MKKKSVQKNNEVKFVSSNKGRGYHGEVWKNQNGDKKAAETSYHKFANKVMNHTGEKDPRAVKHYLDSVHGRFLQGKERDSNYIKLDYARFKRAYKPENFYSEEVMPDQTNKRLDELSKKTLGNYLKKSSTRMAKDLAKHEVSNERHESGLERSNWRAQEKRRRGIKNRQTGIERAVSRLTKESAEQLDELSKKTLRSYIKKATQRRRDHDNVAGVFISGAEDALAKGDKKLANKQLDRADHHSRKARLRKIGINRASKKLAKEGTEQNYEGSNMNNKPEQLDELSKKTLGRYIKKATIDALSRAESGTHSLRDYDSTRDMKHIDRHIRDGRMRVKRQKGINRAVDRLTKESAESLDENVIDLFNVVLNDKPHTASEILENIMADKLSILLDEHKVTVAKRLFNEGDEDEEWDEEDNDLSDEDIASILDELTDDELEEILDLNLEEESEQIDEISKKTLGNYLRKASRSSQVHSGLRAAARADYEVSRNPIYKQEYNYNNRKQQKRQKGIDRAVSRLTKESVENLDELSNKTLRRYLSRNIRKQIDHTRKADDLKRRNQLANDSDDWGGSPEAREGLLAHKQNLHDRREAEEKKVRKRESGEWGALARLEAGGTKQYLQQRADSKKRAAEKRAADEAEAKKKAEAKARRLAKKNG